MLIRCYNCDREFYANVKGQHCPECDKAFYKADGSFEARRKRRIMS
jgi:Zn finger protein HypA/HybF involved in hydrogenase expression